MPVKSLLKCAMTAVLAIASTLTITSCTDSPLQPNNGRTDISVNKPAAGAYPQYAEGTFRYRKRFDGYEGGNFRAHNGSTFHLKDAALTPPPGTPAEEPVTLTMLVERDKRRTELIFTFGPSGCTFDPPAEVWLDWTDLHSTSAILYYIDDNGNYVPQTPDDIDLQGKRLKIYIDHFSRYALSIN